MLFSVPIKLPLGEWNRSSSNERMGLAAKITRPRESFFRVVEKSIWRRIDPQRSRGFSLIEMLVALVVLSLSLGVLYQAAIGATRNVRVAAEYTDAVMLAESMLAENSYILEETFSRSGRFGQFDWVVTSWPAPYEDGLSPEERAIAPQALQYLQIEVTWPGRNEPRSLDLLTVVPLQELRE